MSKKFPWLFMFLLSSLSACSHQPEKPLLIARQPLPQLAAEFETTVIEAHGDERPASYKWRFWRSDDAVETQNLQDNSGEIWSKSADGTVTYQRVFHDQRQIIDYLPGDLKAIGSEPNWQAIATLVNQAMIVSLLADDQEQILGRPTTHYHNSDSVQTLEISWLEHEQLPAMIKRNEHGHTVITRIIALYPLAQSPWPYQRSSTYNMTDFADIGDKENDSFIKSIQHKIKGGQHHNH